MQYSHILQNRAGKSCILHFVTKKAMNVKLTEIMIIIFFFNQNTKS